MMEPAPNMFRKFWDLGYRDLLPVTPPDAKISPRSDLSEKDLGKAPGTLWPDGTWSGRGFARTSTHESDCDAWHAWGAGVGIRGGADLFFVDVDHRDTAKAKRLHALAVQHLGQVSAVQGQAPKFALPYRSTTHIKSEQIKFDEPMVEGKLPGIDIISDTPHKVVAGIHKKSGKPYRWIGGIPAKDSLPVVTQEMFDAFMAAVEAEFTIKYRGAAKTEPREPVDPETLRAPSIEALRKAVEATPNTLEMFPSRNEDYIPFMQAIKGAAGPENDDEAYEIFHEWAMRWPDADEGVVEADWRKAHDSHSIGWNHVRKHAVGLYFKDEADDPIADMFSDGGTAKSPATPRSGFRLIRASDLKLTPPEYLIDDIIEVGTLGVLFGAPSAWKSFMAVHMAACIATGTPFFGHGVQQGAVIYLAGEGQAGLARRRAAWEAGTGVSLDGAPLFFSNMTARMLDAAHTAEIAEAVDEIVKEHGVPRMVFVDTTAKAMVGGDENNTADMTRLLASAEAMQRRYPGCVIQLVHHTGVADPRRLRGSSALKGGVDTEFLMTKEDGVSAFENLKMKDGPMAPTMYFTAEEIILGTTPKGKQFGSLTLRQVQEPVKAKKVTKSMQLGIDTFMDALRSIGNDLGAGVPVDIWRSHFMSKHTADTAHAKRVAFTRTRKDLTDGGFLGVANDVYSLIKLPSGVTLEACDAPDDENGHPFD